MPYFQKIVSVAAVLLLIGAGCTAQNEETPTSTDNSTNTVVTKDADNPTKQASSMYDSGISLKAEAKGNGKVTFSWELGNDVEKTDKFRLIRSEEMDPEFNNKNYWLQVHNTKDEYSWIGLPMGTKHFRICTFNEETNSCEVYSNNVMVEVK